MNKYEPKRCNGRYYIDDHFESTIIIALLIINIVCAACIFREISALKAVLETFEPTEVSAVEVVEKPVEVPQNAEEDRPEYHIPAQWPKLYDDSDAVALAKLVWGEGRGVPAYGSVSTKAQQAAIMWTVLNRYDLGKGDSIIDVITAPNQFVGYNVNHPVEDELLELAYDVLDRWNNERHGETDVGRVLPADYLYFHGDGTYNYFRNEYKSKAYWDWSLEDIYGGAIA